MEEPVAGRLCAIRQKIIDRIGANRFRTWFGGSTELHLDGKRLDVTVANAFIGNWISSNFMGQLVQAARDVLGDEPCVEIRVDQAGPRIASDAGDTTGVSSLVLTAPDARRSEAARVTAPRRREERPVLRGELESFVVGPSNELAHSVACTVARSPGTVFKHVVIHGGCGLGKTHLLHGVCNGLSRAHPTLQWRYLCGEEFTNEFIYAVKAGRIDQFRARFRSVDVFVIDDIHFLANKRATQAEFLHTFNAIDATGKAVVMSCDCHPRGIATLSEPLLNRLAAAMVVRIEPPELATRREILRRRAASMLCELPEEVLDYVARHVTRNVRELEGALYKLAAYSSLTKEPIRLDLARQAIEDYVVAPRPPQAADIERLVAAHFGVTCEAVRSDSRDRTVTQARAVAMYLLRKHTRMSLPEIGRCLGHKQHSTVLMAIRRVQESLDRDGAVAWKAPGGVREVSARSLLEDLEQRLLHRPQASA